MDDVVEIDDGVVWAATDAGLAWFDGFVWRPMDESDGLPIGRPRSIQPDGAGGLWVVSHFRLYRGDTSGFRGFPVEIEGIERPVFEAVWFEIWSAIVLIRDDDPEIAGL